jgi:tetratricopeptide (TPR) repeat protein
MNEKKGAGVADAPRTHHVDRKHCAWTGRIAGVLVIVLAMAGMVRADEATEVLVERGKAALFAAEYEAAAQAFAEALVRNPADVRAMHGAGLAAYHQGQVKEALAALMKAKETAGEKADRALVLNLAALHIESDDPLAAVRLCQSYLQAHSAVPDEPLLNAMGCALVQAMQKSPGREVEKLAEAFMELTEKLERTRPGMKRWGTEWVTAAEYKSLAETSVPEYPPLVELVVLDAPAPGAAGTEVAVTDGGVVERPTDRRGEPAAAAGGDSRQALGIPIAPDLLLTPAVCVTDAHDVSIQSADGESFAATVVRVDSEKNLALLRVKGVRLHYLNLADAFDGGPVQCTAVTKRNLFTIDPTMVAGVTDSPKRVSGVWTVKLESSPALAGAPLTSNGKVIGVALTDAADETKTEVPAISLDEIRGFLGSDMPKVPSRFKLDARSSVYQVTASPRR